MVPAQIALLIGTALAAGGGYVWWRGRGVLFMPTWPDIYRRVRSAFPEVRQIDPDELVRRQGETGVVVVDCRGAKDFAFSHIAGAVNCQSVEEVQRVARPADAVVTYCVIGYRSSMLADKLRRAGFRDVSSLEGAILRWANEDRPLVNSNGEPMTKVSPWLKSWAKHLLKPGKF